MDLHSETEGLGGQLAAEEINVIRGALDLTSKTAAQGMTPLDKVGPPIHRLAARAARSHLRMLHKL